MQGNLVFNAAQELIYRRDLERTVVEAAIRFAAKHGKPCFCCVSGGTHPWTLPGNVMHDTLLHADDIRWTTVRLACAHQANTDMHTETPQHEKRFCICRSHACRI